MGFFSIFKNNSSTPKTISLPVAEKIDSAVESIANVEPTSEEKSVSDKPMIISYATGWPIDIIYGYLHKNYEEKGFSDAMVKSDLTFRDMNMNIIKNKILMVFREINLNYDVMKHDLETRIETCSAAGLLSTVADMEKTMTIINTHKDELRQLECDFRDNSDNTSVPLQSYECGFLRGIATIAMGNNHRSVNLTQPNVGNTSKMAIA